MQDETATTHDPVQLAKQCLATGDELQVLRMHSFGDDAEAHDDAKQDNVLTQFEAAFATTLGQLESAFGPAELGNDEEEPSFVPLCGVFRVASWELNGNQLFLAAAHEDRESPFMLVLGVV